MTVGAAFLNGKAASSFFRDLTYCENGTGPFPSLIIHEATRFIRHFDRYDAGGVLVLVLLAAPGFAAPRNTTAKPKVDLRQHPTGARRRWMLRSAVRYEALSASTKRESFEVGGILRPNGWIPAGIACGCGFRCAGDTEPFIGQAMDSID